MNAKIDPKVEMGSVLFQNWWMEQFPSHQSKIIGRICWWQRTVGCWSEFQAEIHSKWHSTWDRHSVSLDQRNEEIDVTSWRSSWMRQHSADGYWLHEHSREDMHCGENLRSGNSQKERTTHFMKKMCGRWNVKKMRSESSEYVRKTTGSSQTVGESKEFFSELLRRRMPKKVYRWETGWTLRCRLTLCSLLFFSLSSFFFFHFCSPLYIFQLLHSFEYFFVDLRFIVTFFFLHFFFSQCFSFHPPPGKKQSKTRFWEEEK